MALLAHHLKPASINTGRNGLVWAGKTPGFITAFHDKARKNRRAIIADAEILYSLANLPATLRAGQFARRISPGESTDDYFEQPVKGRLFSAVPPGHGPVLLSVWLVTGPRHGLEPPPSPQPL